MYFHNIKKVVSILLILAILILPGCNFLMKEYKPGYWSNDTFFHGWAGINFKLPQGFTIAEKALMESYIADNPKAVVAEPGTKLTDADSILEFLAATDYNNPANIKSIALVIENIKVLNIKNEDDYINYQKQLAELIGFNYYFGEKMTTKINGKTFTYFDAVANTIGTSMIARTCFRIKGDYSIVIQILIMGSNNDSELDALMKSFQN